MISCIADSALALLDEKSCRAWWLRRLHPAGTVCPSCGTSIADARTEAWAEGRLIRCRDCGKFFDNRTGTELSGVHADWKQLTLFVTLLSVRMPAAQIARLCRISDDTVRRLARRFPEVLDV